MADTAIQRISQATQDCFGVPGDLADLTAGLLRSDPEEAECADSKLSGLLSVPPEDLYIPPTAIPLIRHVYRRLPDHKNYWDPAPPLFYSRHPLLRMIGRVKEPTLEALLTLEEITLESARESSLFETLERTWANFGRDAFPSYLRIIRTIVEPDRSHPDHYFYMKWDEWERFTRMIGRSIWNMPLRPEDIVPLVEVLAENPAFKTPGVRKDFLALTYPMAQMGAPALEELSLLCREGPPPVDLVALKAMAVVSWQMPYQSHPVSKRLFAEHFLEALRNSFKKGDPLLTETAIVLLATTTHPSGNRPLWNGIFKALQDPEAEVRYGLVMAIVRDPGLSGLEEEYKNALPFLAAMKEGDPDERCRSAARDAIQKIEKQIL